MARSGVMTIFAYKGLARSPEVGKVTVWIFINILRLEQVKNTKSGTFFFAEGY